MHHPLYWAMAQNNLGDALKALGKGGRGTARLEEAMGAFRAALKEHTRERVPLDWAKAQTNLAETLLALFDRTADQVHLDAATAAVDGALQVFRRAQAEFYIEYAERLRADICSSGSGS